METEASVGSVRLVLVLIIVGVLLDMGISAALYVEDQSVNRNQARIEHVQKKSDCWSHVLDVAVQTKPGPGRTATLNRLADRCIKLK